MPTKVLSMESIRHIDDFAPVYKWELVFPKIPSAMSRVGFSQEDGNRFVFQCTSSSVPTIEGESIEINIRGFKTKEHGLYQPNQTIDLTFAETADYFVNRFLEGWLEVCRSIKTGIQLKKSEVSCDLVLFNKDRQNQVASILTLRGCFIESLDRGGEFSSDTSDIFRPVATISYDYFERS